MDSITLSNPSQGEMGEEKELAAPAQEINYSGDLPREKLNLDAYSPLPLISHVQPPAATHITFLSSHKHITLSFTMINDGRRSDQHPTRRSGTC